MRRPNRLSHGETTQRVTPRVERALLVVVLSTYLCLALWYGIVTPILEPYDEPKHFGFVLSVALDHGLPVQDPSQFQPWGNEGSQPPLYYLLAAAATGWTDRRGYLQSLDFNPYTTLFAPGEPNDNRNLYIHHRAEEFPYHDNVLGIHLARMLSALIGVSALLATYLMAREFFPGRSELVLGATALQAFIPSFIYVNSAVSNDGLVIALASFGLYGCVRVARSEQVTARSALLLGGLIGLATLAKLSALPLVGVGALAIVLPRAGWGRANLARAARQCLLMLGAFLAVCGWWFWRNWALYGELSGTDMMNRIGGLRPQSPTFADLWADLAQIERTFWAAFGTGNIHPDALWLLLPRVLAGLGLLGCAWALTQSYLSSARRSGRDLGQPWKVLPLHANARAVLVCLAWVAVSVAALGWWLYRVSALSGRLLFPVLAPLLLAIVFGLWYLSAPRLRRAVVALGCGGMLVVAACMPGMVIIPAFARPPEIGAAQLSAAGANETAVSFGGAFRLLGYALAEPRTVISQPLHLQLYWQAMIAPPADYAEFAQLIGPGGDIIAEVETVPGRGSFPTSDWAAGAIYRDTLSLYPRKEPAEPVSARLKVGWRPERQVPAFPYQARASNVSSQNEVGRVRLAPDVLPVFHPGHSLAANFGDLVDLVGFDRDAESVTLYWRARTTIAEDYTVFIHVLDADGRIVAQADNQPRQGEYPTSLWQPGEVVRDSHRLSVPAGANQVRVGLYLLQTGQRLPIAGLPDDSVLLP